MTDLAQPGRSPRVLSARQGKWLLTLYPPLLFQRVRVVRFSEGFRVCEVRVARSILTRNLGGSTFGGTIFSAADPFYAVMYWQALARRGRHVEVWLRRATATYTRPARSALTLHFELTANDLDVAERALDAERRHVCRHRTEAVDRDGTPCAVIETEVYLAPPP